MLSVFGWSHLKIRIQAARTELLVCMLILAGLVLLVSCQTKSTSSPAAAQPEEIVVFDWNRGISPIVVAKFTAATGIRVRSLYYGTQEDAVAALQGKNAYDVVVIEDQYIPELIRDHLLAPIDNASIPNFKNISPNFRDLVFDPNNRYSVPYEWGITGLIVRKDLLQTQVNSWSDLWSEQYTGKIAMWNLPRYNIGVALKSLGYSANSADKAQLEAAAVRLDQIRTRTEVEEYGANMSPTLANGKAAIGVGFASDMRYLRENKVPVDFILPAEGTILWQENLLIPAQSRMKTQAEQFINFILAPENGALMTEYTGYATCNQSAYSYLPTDLLADPITFPPPSSLKQAELLLEISAGGESEYTEIWNRFIGH
jgi:spermidine/putrescine transport system substrate-binding protein